MERNNLGYQILNSLPQFINTLKDPQTNVFEKQENFEKIICGLTIVAQLGLKDCQEIQDVLDSNM